MKKILAALAVVAMSASAQAKTVVAEKIQISPSSVDQVVRLVDKNEPGSSHKKLSIVVADNGMSTDVSPRYRVYMAYASLAEMGNLSADFLISAEVMKFISAKRISGGIYEVVVTEFNDNGFQDVTYKINATKMFSDEKKMREKCDSEGGFCDGELTGTVELTSTAK